ncbi:unnamed protein product [Phaedon cochleariae]|uniref:Uncharacterized protein n=1 Tax=Phaedon cochleariae TaxID=80249 RepID=A0A9P0GU01_PHACE|nr:unnamed protein product [Phaedon cochleariae]
MKILFSLFVMLSISSIYAQMDVSDYGVALDKVHTEMHDKCTKDHPVTHADIWRVKIGIFDDNNEEMKKYILCLWRISGMIDLDTFRLSKILLDVYLPKEVHKGNGPNMYLECAAKGRDLPAGTALQERTWVLMKCVQHADPVNFVMF